jgi:hypothetical protein
MITIPRDQMINPLLALLAVLLYLWVVFTKADENVFLKQLLNKFRIFFNAVAFMVMCKDNKGVGQKYNPDPELLKDKTTFSKKIGKPPFTPPLLLPTPAHLYPHIYPPVPTPPTHPPHPPHPYLHSPA